MSKIVLVEMTRQCYNTVNNRFIRILQGEIRRAIEEAGDRPVIITTMPGVIENIKVFEN